jgi:hypothetical protein
MHDSFFRRRPATTSLAVAVVLALLAPFAPATAAFADDDYAPAADAAVARIDAISGDVAIQRGDSADTVAAVPNAPLLGADYVTTGPGARAEIGFDGRAAVRLGDNVQMRFARIDPQNRDLQLAAGTIDLRLFGDTDGQSSIDTPSISVVPRSAGSYRVSVDENGETTVTVRSGHADIVTPQWTQPLDPGTTLVADGPAANPQVQYAAAVALDRFDAYNADRDRIYTVAQSQAPYVNPNIQGVGDLSAAGRWVPDGSYGNVWIPVNVAPDWAPYRDGNWVWEDGYGWTWVANESWGWAPYHYGRWYFSDAYHRWAWFPPERGRPVPAWSPALVGFVGFNVGAVSVGFGNIGWVPLAPYEPFHPCWGARRGGSSVSINATFGNTSIRYRNSQVAGAMTAVTRENFQNGRFEHPFVASPLQMRAIQTVPLQGPLPVVPSRANLRFTQQGPAPSLGVRPSFAGQGFAGRATFAPRTPFAEQQANVSRSMRLPYAPQPAAPGYGPQAAPPAYAPPSYGAPPAAAPAARSVPNDPWQRFGGPRQSTVPAQPAPAYARPTGPAYAAPSYVRPPNPSYATPGYVAPAYPQRGYAAPVNSGPGYQRTAPPVSASGRMAPPAEQRRAPPAESARPAASESARPEFHRQY